MEIGDIVLVPVNGGHHTEAQVIGIYGDTIVVAGFDERQMARDQARDPIGVGFRRTVVIELEKAKTS